MAFGPGGRSLYSVDDDQVLRRWDLDTGHGEIVDRCLGGGIPWDEQQVTCVAPDANEVHVHDLLSGEMVRLRAEGTTLGRNTAVSADRRWVAAGTEDAGVVLWDRQTGGSHLLRLTRASDDAGGDPRELRFSADSTRLLVPMEQHVVVTYEMATGRASLLRPHSGFTYRANFSPDGTLIASVGSDIGVMVSDLVDGSDRSLVGARMIDAQFSRDGQYLAAVGNDPRVFVWTDDVFRQRSWRLPEGRDGLIIQDAPGMETAALAHGDTLTIVDTMAVSPRLRLELPRPLTGFVLTPDARHLAGLDGELTLRVWNAHTGALLHVLAGNPTTGECAIHAMNDDHVALVCADGVARWVDLVTAEIRDITESNRAFVGSVAFEPSRGTLLLSEVDGRIHIWDPTHPGLQPVEHQHPVHTRALLAIVPGHSQVVIVHDRRADVWDLVRGEGHPLAEPPRPIHAITVSDERRLIATSSQDNFLRISDRETGTLLRMITSDSPLGDLVRLSPDGGMLASTTSEHDIWLWDLGGEPGEQIEPRLLTGHGDRIVVLRFAADGNSLISIDNGGRVIRWADDLPRDPDGVRAWVAAHRGPMPTPMMRSGCSPPPPR